MPRERLTLSSGWQWRLANSNSSSKADSIPEIKKWIPASTFPSVIQLELLHAKLLPDPNVGENERLIQWVGEADWEYSCAFPTPYSGASRDKIELLFEGLDTFATVQLNGKQILQSDNMFIPHRVDIKDHLQPSGTDNEIVILFESAFKKGQELEKTYGQRISIMRDPKRMHIRKAQYHWGWDWGPIIVTCGPYLPIHIETYNSRIDTVHVTSNLFPDVSWAMVHINVNTVASSEGANTVLITVLDADGEEVIQSDLKVKDGKATATKVFPSPNLWWPNGEGDQYLYTLKTTLLGAEKVLLDETTTRFALRSISLIQRPLDDEPGTTFMFNVNGRDIFIQGGNWIPADNLLPRITREKYFAWIGMAKKSHLNMIRVWGGGIYETEDFFDACDENGILVWHDLAFACGDYPIHDAFLENVTKEVEAQVTRIRNRACLALLCGGNEDFMLAEMGVGDARVEFDARDVAGPFEDTDFPQRKIYLQLLPDITKELCPEVKYWPNSPWGGDSTSDPTVGDIHQWSGVSHVSNNEYLLEIGYWWFSVWHQEQLSYQQYKNLSGRFVSEFGMHGFPIMRTVDAFVPDVRDRYPQSKAIDCHNKGHGAETRIARYLAENFRYNNQSLEDFAYCSQLMQSEAYGYALRDWKRKFNGKGKEACAGAIIWQLNDCYPVTSWSFIDYYLRVKPSFYSIRRVFAPISVGIERTPLSLWIDEDHPRKTEIPRFSIFAHNTTTAELSCTLVLAAYDFFAGERVEFPSEKKAVTLLPGQNTELGEVENPKTLTDDSLIVLSASLVDDAGTILARIVNWPEPFRYLHWPKDTRVDLGTSKADEGAAWEDIVTIKANQPIKGLFLYPDYDRSEGENEPEPVWEDNMLDLMPGEQMSVGVKGLRGRGVKPKFLADWEM